MTSFWAGLALGVASSAHCAAMCGPLVVALRRGLFTPGASARVRACLLLYQAGRVAMYGVLGLVVGRAGAFLAARDLGRALAVGAGVALLAGVTGLAAARLAPIARHLGHVVSRATVAMRRRGLDHPFATATGLGALNGLLPCGLVYAALAVAITANGAAPAALFMVAFGLGTTPVLAGLWVASSTVLPAGHRGTRLIAAAAVVIAGLLLVGRGVVPSGHHH